MTDVICGEPRLRDLNCMINVDSSAFEFCVYIFFPTIFRSPGVEANSIFVLTLGIKLGLAACKALFLPVVLSLCFPELLTFYS